MTFQNPWAVRMVGGDWAGIDREQVSQAMRLLFDPDAHHVISTQSGVNHYESRLVGLADLPGALAALDAISEEARKTYWTLNPVGPELKGPNANGGDVLHYRWLMIDCDRSGAVKTATGASKLMATQEEREGVHLLVQDVLAFLHGRGWPEPVVLDSGSGYHALYRVLLERSRGSQQLIKRVLTALAQQCDTERADIDTACSNAIRGSKLPGTWVRKGPNLPERPHRMAVIVTAPGEAAVVTLEQLEGVAALMVDPKAKLAPAGFQSPWKVKAAPQERNGNYVNAVITKEVGEVRGAGAGNHNNTLNTAAFNLGTLVNYPDYSRTEMERVLEAVADEVGQPEGEARGTIRSGLDAGELKPRDPLKEREHGTGGPSRTTRTFDKPEDPLLPEGYYQTLTDADLGIVPLTTVQSRPTQWHWIHRFARGNMAITAGDGGIGKSQFLLYLAYLASIGGDFPDGSGKSPLCDTVIVSAEDSPATTIKPRLEAMGADIDRILIVKARYIIHKKDKPSLVNYTDLQDHGYWKEIFDRLPQCSLFIVDPLPSYLGRGVNDSRNMEIRQVLEPFISEVIEPRNICMIGNTHLNKAINANTPMHRISGSTAYGNLPRNVHIFVRSPETPEVRLVRQPKTNNAPDNLPGLAFRVESREIIGADGEVIETAIPVFETETDDVNLGDALNGKVTPRGPSPKKETETAEWLHDFLETSAGQAPCKDIFAAAGQAGLIGKWNPETQKWSNGTLLYRARDRIGSLGGEREGARIEEVDMKTERDRYPRIHWRLLSEKAPF